MYLTEKVSLEWLSSNNMRRGDEIGIPVDLDNLSKGLRWRHILGLKDEDFDILDRYYETKISSKSNNQ